jgi:hypothetical protein
VRSRRKPSPGFATARHMTQLSGFWQPASPPFAAVCHRRLTNPSPQPAANLGGEQGAVPLEVGTHSVEGCGIRVRRVAAGSCCGFLLRPPRVEKGMNPMTRFKLSRCPIRCLGWDRSDDRVRAHPGTHGQDALGPGGATRVVGRLRIMGRLIMPSRRHETRNSVWGSFIGSCY